MVLFRIQRGVHKSTPLNNNDNNHKIIIIKQRFQVVITAILVDFF